MFRKGAVNDNIVLVIYSAMLSILAVHYEFILVSTIGGMVGYMWTYSNGKSNRFSVLGFIWSIILALFIGFIVYSIAPFLVNTTGAVASGFAHNEILLHISHQAILGLTAAAAFFAPKIISLLYEYENRR